MKLRHAKLIDFTGSVKEFSAYSKFDQSVIDHLRDKGKAEVAIIVDRAYEIDGGFAHKDAPFLVADHLNLTGSNPLVGPNNPIGERFPVVNNIYLSAADTMDQEETWTLGNPLGKMSRGIACGVKDGLLAGPSEQMTMKNLGGDFYCYHLVPSMIVAAHAGLKVIALGIKEGQALAPDVIACLLR